MCDPCERESVDGFRNIGDGYSPAGQRSVVKHRGPPDTSDRAAITDQYLAAMLTLRGGDAATFKDARVAFRDIAQAPRPVQHPHPPLVLGGDAAASYERAGRFGNGWFGWDLTPNQASESIDALLTACARNDRNEQQLEITVKPPIDLTPTAIDDCAAVGVDRLIIQPNDFTTTEIERRIDTFATTLRKRDKRNA